MNNKMAGQRAPDPFIHTIDLNKGGYVFEKFEL
jgi:hypothetical protein